MSEHFRFTLLYYKRWDGCEQDVESGRKWVEHFRGKKHLFEGLAMERLEKDWAEYPVLFDSATRTIGEWKILEE